MDNLRLYGGIDPGSTGGLGVVDGQGHHLLSLRWDAKQPRRLYQRLEQLRPHLVMVYVEIVRLFPGHGMGLAVTSQGLLVNSGIWQGWLIALGIPYREVDPRTWQSATGLQKWRERLKAYPNTPTPLSVARERWPDAALDAQADDGRAVGLILADLVRRDALFSFIRGKEPLRADPIAKERRRRARAKRKAQAQAQPTTLPMESTP